jgi:eukaryotic-like serine/threonine-protein kinase
VATCPTCQNRFDGATFCPRDGARLVGDRAAGALLGGRYRLIRKVGEGGMGEVYEAEHALIHRRVAVKILQRNLAQDPQAIERLQREAQSTSGLGHPNIVDTLDFGYSDDGQVFLVMEWLDGENLDQRLRREPVSLPSALDIAAQAAAGLAEAHDRGVIHRDLKPANLFLTRDRRGALVVTVLDFGIAKLAIHQTKLTGTGVLVGTPNYMAPEQAFGDEIDARADVYALGVILYEMVTGSVPFHADSPLAVLHQHTSRMPVPPSTVAPDREIPPEVEALVMRCLAKKPADRFGSMHELASAIDDVRRMRRAPPPAPRAPMEEAGDDDLLRAAGVRGGRRGLLLASGGALLAAGVIVGFLSMRGDDRGDAPPQRARDAAGPVAASADAADAAPPIDAAATQLVVDAEPTPAISPDAAPAPGWRRAGKGKASSFSARIDVAPRPGEPFDLQIVLSDLRGALHDAGHAGALRAEVSVAYFKDHAVVHTSSHDLDDSLAISVPLQLDQAGKHHVSVALRSGERRLDRLRFDIFVGSR